MFGEIHEECGVFGAYRVDNAASITYYGLHSLQHRGQEASGIAVSDGENITLQKGKGLTVDVFQREKLDSMVGRLAVGHVRYSTAGGQENENIQPSIDMLIRLSRLFNVSTDYLLGMENIPRLSMEGLPPNVVAHLSLLIEDYHSK